MATDYDVIIVGAGMFGSSTAKHVRLLRPDLRVACIGPDNNNGELARGQHFDEARICRRVETIEGLAFLNEDGANSFLETEAQSGIDFYTPCGLVWVLPKSDEVSVRRCYEAVKDGRSGANKTSVPLIDHSKAPMKANADAAEGYQNGHSSSQNGNGHANGSVTPLSSVVITKNPLEAERLVGHSVRVSQFASNNGPTYYCVDKGACGGGTIHPTNYVLAQLKLAASVEPTSNYTYVNDVVTSIDPVEPDGDGAAERVYTIATTSASYTTSKVIVASSIFSAYHKLVPEGVAARLHPTAEHVILLRVRAPHDNHDDNIRASELCSCVIRTNGDSVDDQFYCLPPRYYADRKGWFVKMGGAHTGEKPNDVSTLAQAMDWYNGQTPVAAGSVANLTKMLTTVFPDWPVVTEAPEEPDLQNTYVVRCIWDMTVDQSPLIDTIDGKGWYCAIGGNGRGAKCCDPIGKIAAYRTLRLEMPREMAWYEHRFLL